MPDYTELMKALREHGNLRKACKELGVSRSAFLDRVASDPALADQYAREKQHGVDAMMEELLEKPIEDAAKDRLEWDRKRWHASKLYAKKYGDKLAVGGADDLPAIQNAHVGLDSVVSKLIAATGASETDALRALAATPVETLQ